MSASALRHERPAPERGDRRPHDSGGCLPSSSPSVWRPVDARPSGGAGLGRCAVAGRRAEAERPVVSPRHPSVHARRRARVRRRRALLATVIGAVLVALALPWGGAGGRPLATSGPVLAGAAPAAHADYVVQAGDTLWSIAVRLDPSGDPRVVVGKLEAQTGSDTVVPGEHLRLP
ncbi:MAG: LysM peptidoglycan-binding domain-containing protein [Acidobacteriota bacterium]|nr:LysM peptidoglycan-binding domain-containing protein [Acidobacteriota bacterium]